MSYTSAQYQQFEEEEKAHKISKRGTSDYDTKTRFMARRGHREAYAKLEEEEAKYQEPEHETVSKRHKTISVTQYKPESIQPKSVKIRTSEGKKERFEKRKGEREGTVTQAAKELGGYVVDNIKRGFKETHMKPKKEKAEKEPEPVQAQHVEDKDTIRTVSKALTTRSGELRNIEEGAYRKQSAVENKKQIEKENAKAQRKGQLRGMGTFDRVVETVADATAKPIEWKEQLEEARAKVLHTQGRPRQKVTNKVP